jgi:hypothetical protein
VIELLSQHWGFYFNASNDDWGSDDMMTLRPAVQKYLNDTRGSFIVDREANNGYARRRHFYSFSLVFSSSSTVWMPPVVASHLPALGGLSCKYARMCSSNRTFLTCYSFSSSTFDITMRVISGICARYVRRNERQPYRAWMHLGGEEKA